MIDADRQNFKRMMNALMVIYYKPELTNDALRVWWGKLEKYEFNEVSKAIDDYTNSDLKAPPVPHDIVKLCQHKVSIHARLPSPLTKEANAEYAKEVVDFVASQPRKKRDFKAWARNILATTKNYPDIAVRFAKEALEIKDEVSA